MPMPLPLRTDRLVLRRFTAEDTDDVHALDNDPRVMRYLNGGQPVSREVVQTRTLPRLMSYDERFPAFGYRAALDRATGRFLGWFEFQGRPGVPGEVELGYRLLVAAWGRGFATEGARALIRMGFTDLDVERVVATTMTVNRASRRVLEKAGLTLVRTFHQEWPDVIEGAEHGDVEYEVRRAAWRG
ncbi:MAG TPA: GNAT family N-acetyltransferase [Catenuloplanes sp.]|jgi:RimJ/RimL family protein N-acetyltransferase